MLPVTTVQLQRPVGDAPDTGQLRGPMDDPPDTVQLERPTGDARDSGLQERPDTSGFFEASKKLAEENLERIDELAEKMPGPWRRAQLLEGIQSKLDRPRLQTIFEVEEARSRSTRWDVGERHWEASKALTKWKEKTNVNVNKFCHHLSAMQTACEGFLEFENEAWEKGGYADEMSSHMQTVKGMLNGLVDAECGFIARLASANSDGKNPFGKDAASKIGNALHCPQIRDMASRIEERIGGYGGCKQKGEFTECLSACAKRLRDAHASLPGSGAYGQDKFGKGALQLPDIADSLERTAARMRPSDGSLLAALGCKA